MENEFVREETVESRIFGLQAEVDQMKRMIDENVRKIAEGDDVKGREYLMKHLKEEVAKKSIEILKLKTEAKE